MELTLLCQDFARSGIEILVEVMHELRKRDLLKNGFEVYIDGGVRRAGDIIKAVARESLSSRSSLIGADCSSFQQWVPRLSVSVALCCVSRIARFAASLS